jgi:hypothetical protein
MSTIRRTLGAAIATLILCASSFALAAMAPGTDHEHGGPMHCEPSMHYRLDEAANRLEIKASQQKAWQTYTASVEAMTTHPDKHPVEDADAATIARFHADMANQMAAKLQKVADATAKLQAVLTPEQRKTFDQMARHFGHHGDHSMQHHDHGGQDHAEHGDDGHDGQDSPPSKP